MSAKRILTFIPIFLIGLIIHAQTVKIPFEKRVKDEAFDKSQSILPIYKYSGKSIEPYSKFGLEMDDKLPWYTIKTLPDMTGMKDTGYTYIYFAGADNAESQGYLLTLVGNYKRSRRTIYFYVDKNNDFDFTNDGSPDSITWQQQNFDITLENSKIPGATYAIELSRFKYGQNVRYKKLLTEHYKSHSGSKEFTDINYCFREQRYNCIAAHYKSDTDSFTIGIKDMNVNGVYNEGCSDLVYVGAYRTQIVNDNLFNLKPTINENAFEWNNKKWRFVSIETTGAYIEITQDDKAVLSNKLEIGKKVSNFSYVNVIGKKHELKEYKKQEVFIFFWDKESISDEDTLYLKKLHKEYKDEVKIISLNHGDEPKQARIMFYYDKIPYTLGYSSTEIANQFYLEDVTQGYYLTKKCVLVDDEISPKELYDRLSTK